MEKRIKYLLVALLCIMLISTLAAALITLWLSTTGKLRLILPLKVEADITEWDWGLFILDNESITLLEKKQTVQFTNLGTTPLQLYSDIDTSTVFPAWLESYLALTWSAEENILAPFASIDTNFTLSLMADMARQYMSIHEIIEVDFGFDIKITAVEASVTYSLTINNMTGGTTDPTPGTHDYALGSSVPVQAIPDADYNFDYWILDAETRTENPTYVTMDADHTLTAYFKGKQIYGLSITTTDGGTTDPVPGLYNYLEGSSVSVTAIPDVDFVFDCWNLDGVNDTANPISVLMDANHSLTAYFIVPPVKPTIVYVDPEYNNFAVGETFTITVVVADVEDLWNWQVKLLFNPVVLECTDAFIPSDSPFKFAISPSAVIDNVAGSILIGSTQMGDMPGEDGSGILVCIEFLVKSEGVSDLTLDPDPDTGTKLRDSIMTPISFDIENGYFSS